MPNAEKIQKFPGAVLRSRTEKWPSLLLPAGEDNRLAIRFPMEDGSYRECSIELHDVYMLSKFTAALCARLDDMIGGLNGHLSNISATRLANVLVDNLLSTAKSDMDATLKSSRSDWISIESVGLSVRAYNIAREVSIPLTLGGLAKLTEMELRKVKYCGQKTINEFKAVLAKHGKELAK